MRTCWPQLWLTLCALLAARGAWAQEVVLETGSCPELDALETQRLLMLELKREIVVGPAEVVVPAYRASFRCVRQQGLAEVTMSSSGRQMNQSLSLATYPTEAWPRLAALALAELVRTLEDKPTAILLSKAEAAGPAAADERAVVSRWRAAGIVGSLWPAGSGLPVWTAGAAVRRAFSQRAGASLGLLAHFGERRDSLGVVKVTGASMRALFDLEWVLGPFTVAPGAGVRGGAFWLEGRPTDSELATGSTLSGPWGGGCLSLAVSYAPTRTVFFAVNLETGWALFGLIGHSDGTSPLVLSRAWVGASAAIGVAF